MKRVRARAECQVQAQDTRWKWLLLALLAAVAILLAAGHAAPVHATPSTQPYVTDATGTHSGCDETGGATLNHCHLTIACFAYAQLGSGTAACQPMAATVHGLPMAQGMPLGQTPRPDLQPPQHSNQA